MKFLNKLGLFMLVLVSVFLLTGCGEKEVHVEGKLEDLMTKVYKDLPEDQTPMALTNIEVTAENVEGFLGTKDIEYTEALASESMVGSIAHSVVLVRLAEDVDAAEAVELIKKSANPRKWICVEAEEVVVKNKGDLLILIMTAENGDILEAGFDGLE